MYEYEILQELEEQNEHLITIEENQDTMNTKLIEIQQQLESGDNNFIEQITYTKNFIGIEIIILMTILVYLFIVRSLK